MCILSNVNILRINFVTSRFRENLSENPACQFSQSGITKRKCTTLMDEAGEKVIVLSWQKEATQTMKRLFRFHCVSSRNNANRLQAIWLIRLYKNQHKYIRRESYFL